MDLTIESDRYVPNIGDDDNYIDYLPSSSKFKHGIQCPCGSRKDYVFVSRPSFACHIKTKTHIKWLSELNKNKMNFFTKCEKIKEVVNSQKIMIAQMEKEIYGLKQKIHIKSKTIDILTEQLISKPTNMD
jgi:hypothetical protein